MYYDNSESARKRRFKQEEMEFELGHEDRDVRRMAAQDSAKRKAAYVTALIAKRRAAKAARSQQ